MRRPLALGLLVLPLGAAGTLAAHALAYALVDAPPEGVHGYLGHLPQLLTILALPALLSAAVAGRALEPRAWPFAAVGLIAFVLQEHLERFVHTGQVPFLLDRPVFLVGLALQVPFAVAVWLLARALLRAARGRLRAAPPRVPSIPLSVVARAVSPRASRRRRLPSPRGPPALRAG